MTYSTKLICRRRGSNPLTLYVSQNRYSISASPRSCKEFSTFLTLLDSPDYFSFLFGKLFSLLPTAFRMNKIPTLHGCLRIDASYGAIAIWRSKIWKALLTRKNLVICLWACYGWKFRLEK